MTAQVTTLQALRTPNFALFWSAQVISGFGDKVTLVALAFVTWELTRSALFTAFSVVIATIPYAVFGFVAGAIADALGHRRAMIACDIVRVGAIGLIPGALMLGMPLGVAYALVFVAALCSAIFNPARMGLVPDLVPRDHLGASNAMINVSDRAVEIVGSIIAGVLVAALGTAAFYVDALTFALSALLLARVSLPERQVRPVHLTRILGEAGEGLRFLGDNAILRANTVFSLLAQLCIPVLNSLTPVLIFREYGLGAEGFGVAEAALAAGAVIAGITIAPAFGRMPKGRMLVGGFMAYGLSLIGIAAAPSFPIALLFFALAGVTNVVFLIPNVTISQEVAPVEMRARVFGARIALLHLTWLPIVLASGMIAELVDVKVIIAVAGGFTVAVALIGSRFRSIRDVP